MEQNGPESPCDKSSTVRSWRAVNIDVILIAKGNPWGYPTPYELSVS
jgi:hypothetical protein